MLKVSLLQIQVVVELKHPTNMNSQAQCGFAVGLCDVLETHAGDGPSVEPRFVGGLQNSKAGVDSGSGGVETLVHERIWITL